MASVWLARLQSVLKKAQAICCVCPQYFHKQCLVSMGLSTNKGMSMNIKQSSCRCQIFVALCKATWQRMAVQSDSLGNDDSSYFVDMDI